MWLIMTLVEKACSRRMPQGDTSKGVAGRIWGPCRKRAFAMVVDLEIEVVRRDHAVIYTLLYTILYRNF